MDTTYILIGALFLIMIVGLLLNNSKHKEQIEKMQNQIDELCKLTGNQQIASYFISDEDKEYITNLKNSGKEVEAIKKVRELTSMDLVQAKEYVDTLN